MTSEHCVLQALGRCVHNCEKCPQRARRFSLKDIDGNLLPVRTDVNGRSRIWAAHPLDATPQADQLVEAGVRWLLADCTPVSYTHLDVYKRQPWAPSPATIPSS